MSNKIPDFKSVKKNADEIENLNERLLYLQRAQAEYAYSVSNVWFSGIDYDDDHEGRAYEQEIKYVRKLINLDSMESEAKSHKQSYKAIEPIWWQGTSRLLGYLMEELTRERLIDRNTNINRAIKDHFIDKSKNHFPDSIAQNRSGSANNKGSSKRPAGKPKGHERVEEVIKKVKQNGHVE
jgi:hypothetical protein